MLFAVYIVRCRNCSHALDTHARGQCHAAPSLKRRLANGALMCRCPAFMPEKGERNA